MNILDKQGFDYQSIGYYTCNKLAISLHCLFILQTKTNPAMRWNPTVQKLRVERLKQLISMICFRLPVTVREIVLNLCVHTLLKYVNADSCNVYSIFVMGCRTHL